MDNNGPSSLPHTIGWEADLEPSWAVRAVTVTCRGFRLVH